jgi:hypothetical protein
MEVVLRNLLPVAFGLVLSGACRYDPVLLVPPVLDAAGSSDSGAAEDPLAPPVPPAPAGGVAPDAAPDRAPDPPTVCAPSQTTGCYTGAAATRGVGVCRDGLRSCLPDGSWGECQGQKLPGTEACNGADDDCDGATDKGCPIDGALLATDGARTTSPIFGSFSLDQNQPVTHRCPPGQVIAAFTGHSGYAIDSLGVDCAALRVREDRGAMPLRYPLAVERGESFAPVGGTSGGINNATRCPPGFVASGVGAWPSRPATVCPMNYCAGVSAPDCPSNFGLEILCSRYQIEGAPGSFQLAQVDEPPFRTAARVEVDLSGFGFPASKAEYRCPTGQILVEVVGRLGPWPYDCAKTTLNGLQVACARPTVRMR